MGTMSIFPTKPACPAQWCCSYFHPGQLIPGRPMFSGRGGSPHRR